MRSKLTSATEFVLVRDHSIVEKEQGTVQAEAVSAH